MTTKEDARRESKRVRFSFPHTPHCLAGRTMTRGSALHIQARGFFGVLTSPDTRFGAVAFDSGYTRPGVARIRSLARRRRLCSA